ncbi:hypothetical protein CSPAE12_04057 [Colletotrichum incanum]|nr:hypothetical protein CSPAE12_04057 [Colletotrichum incanum]
MLPEASYDLLVAT